MAGNNPPEVVVPMSRALAEFMLKNCETNIEYGLQFLQGTENRETAKALIDQLEQFKELRSVTKAALAD